MFKKEAVELRKRGNKTLFGCFVYCPVEQQNECGRTVTTVISPRKTPFAITSPISLPSVNCMKHSAKKPKTVVSEEPKSETKVYCIALSIASALVACLGFSSSNRSIRKTEKSIVTPNCRIAAMHCVMYEILPNMTFVPMLYTIA